MPATGAKINDYLKRNVYEENILWRQVEVLLCVAELVSVRKPFARIFFPFRPLSKRQITLQTNLPNNSTITQLRKPHPEVTQTYRAPYVAGKVVEA
jgi:hypothetical protein